MREDNQSPQINMSKMQSGGGIAGAMFALISTVIFLFGIPALWFFLPAAIVLGCGVALIIRFTRRQTPGRPWILPATQAPDGASLAAQKQPPSHNPGQPGDYSLAAI
jgi:hypothetical protein